MKTYFVCAYDDSRRNRFLTLYQVDNKREPIITGSYTYEFDIVKVLIGSNRLNFRKDENGYYKWSWKSFSTREFPALYDTDPNDNKKLIEFEDDDAALLWFKLTY